MGLRKRKESRWDLQSELIRNHINNDRGRVWRSKNGDSTAISVMDTNHIKNALAMIKRGAYEKKKDKKIVAVLETELLYRTISGNKKQK